MTSMSGVTVAPRVPVESGMGNAAVTAGIPIMNDVSDITVAPSVQVMTLLSHPAHWS